MESRCEAARQQASDDECSDGLPPVEFYARGRRPKDERIEVVPGRRKPEWAAAEGGRGLADLVCVLEAENLRMEREVRRLGRREARIDKENEVLRETLRGLLARLSS